MHYKANILTLFLSGRGREADGSDDDFNKRNLLQLAVSLSTSCSGMSQTLIDGCSISDDCSTITCDMNFVEMLNHIRAKGIFTVILLHEKLLQFDWLRAVVFQLNLKHLHVKITNLLRVVV